MPEKNTDPFVIGHYFELLKGVLKELNLVNIPNHIWNLDETCMASNLSKTKVAGAPCSRTTGSTGKDPQSKK